MTSESDRDKFGSAEHYRRSAGSDPMKELIERQYGVKVKGEVDAKIGDDLCDFCSKPDPEWDYECPDFIVSTEPRKSPRDTLFVEVSRNDWAACEACASFIEQKQWNNLHMRCATVIWVKHNMERKLEDVLRQVRQIQAPFREHYSGNRKAYRSKKET